MKKIGLLFLPLVLAACDKPDVVLDLQPCCDMGEKYEVIRMSLWNDGRAQATVNGQDIVMTEKTEDRYGKRVDIKWVGIVPDANQKIEIYVAYDTEKRILHSWTVSDELNHGYATDVVMRLDLIKHKQLTPVQLCIEEIDEKTRATNDAVFVSRRRYFYDYRGQSEDYRAWDFYAEKIPAEDAIKISKNWDYKNLKLYQNNTSGVEEHEQDACEVLARLDAYIKKQGWDTPRVVYENEIKCDVPQQIVYLTCDMFKNAQFDYLTLRICEDGRHTLGLEQGLWRSIQMTQENKLGGVLYSGTDYGMEEYHVLYNPNEDKWFARFSGASGAYGECQVGQLQPHQICARQIANRARIEPDGSVALDIRPSQTATKGGYSVSHEFVSLTQEQALKISKNWDYNNMKLYQYGNDPHEADACDVWRRLEDVRRELMRTHDK